MLQMVDIEKSNIEQIWLVFFPKPLCNFKSLVNDALQLVHDIGMGRFGRRCRVSRGM